MVNGVIFSSQGGGVKVTGLSAKRNEESNDVLISNLQIEGALVLDGVEGFVFSGWLAGSLLTTPSTTRCYVSGIIEGVIENKAHCAISADQEVSPKFLSVESTDNAGHIGLIDGTVTYRFKQSFSVVPICTASDTDSMAPVQVTVTPSDLTLYGRGNDSINYICLVRK
jgi:hypothetical protein